jgi:two-component system response regulator PilR (NtrC family)
VSAGADVARGASILVVDDEEVVRDVLQRLLSRQGYEVTAVASAGEGLRCLEGGDFDVLLLDLMLPDRPGMEVLREVRERDPDLAVIMITAFATVQNAVEAMLAGAFHYLTKPFKNPEVLVLVANALERRALREENRSLRKALTEKFTQGKIVGKSPAMQEVFSLLEQVAPSRSTVLIMGESGTGKELVAQSIHARSRRADGPFVVVHSGSLPADLLESNLFGHTRGAFTGAVTAKKGLFEVADGGTIFFDEISTVQPEVQAKLLRVMQEKEFLPVGSTKSLKVDVRIVAATNVDLIPLVQDGRFREDLYYRLNVIQMDLPPLRDRRGDVPLLAEHFVRKFAAENGKAIRGLTAEALQCLLDHPWPGNVRELENAIERAVVLTSAGKIDAAQLPDSVRGGGGPLPGPGLPEGVSLSKALERYEKNLLQRTLQRAGGVQKRAAEILGVKPQTLHEKMKRLGIKA